MAIYFLIYLTHGAYLLAFSRSYLVNTAAGFFTDSPRNVALAGAVAVVLVAAIIAATQGVNLNINVSLIAAPWAALVAVCTRRRLVLIEDTLRKLKVTKEGERA